MIWEIREHIFNMIDYIAGGGIIMIPLVIISFIMWVLIINRVIYFRQLYTKNMSRKIAGEAVLAKKIPDRKKYKGAVALLVTEFMKKRTGNSELDADILDEIVLVIVSSLDRYLSIISLLASIAPLCGLLGTVTGMVATFDVISVFGTGNARALAGGISEALITTQTGLLIAIPGLYMSGFLQRRSEKLKQRIAALSIYLKRYV